MKKASFITISILITLFLTGNYIIYKQVVKSHKKEFKAFIRSRYVKTQTISISPSELFSNNSRINWLDNNKEIVLNDVIYDVISYKSDGVKVLLTVVEDGQEKELMNNYKKQFDRMYSNSSEKKQNSFAKDFFAFKYLSHQHICIHLHESIIELADTIANEVIKGFITSITPPPDRL